MERVIKRLKRFFYYWRKSEPLSVSSLFCYSIRKLYYFEAPFINDKLIFWLVKFRCFQYLIDIAAMASIRIGDKKLLRWIASQELHQKQSAVSPGLLAAKLLAFYWLEDVGGLLELEKFLGTYEFEGYRSHLFRRFFDTFSNIRDQMGSKNVSNACYRIVESIFSNQNNKDIWLLEESRLWSLVGNGPSANKVCTVINGKEQELSIPEVWAKSERSFFKVRNPDVNLFKVERGCIVGANQIVDFEKLKHVLFDETSSSSNGLVAGVWRNFVAIGVDESQNRKVFFYCESKTIKHLEGSAFLVGGRASGNYFHWLFEDLPKMYAFVTESKRLAGIKNLVLDAQMPPQHFEALKMLLERWGLQGLNLVKRSPGDWIRFNKLYSTSLHTYHPDRFDLPYSETCSFSVEMISFLRKTFLPLDPKVGRTFGKKIYITRRPGAGRSISNSSEVSKLLLKHGYQEVFPENLSFLEQVKMFSTAEIIVAQSGAGLTNVLFCSPGTSIISLTSSRNENYPMYSSIAEFNQCRFVQVAGPNDRDRKHFKNEDIFAHSSFSIPIERLESAISSL